MIRHLLKRGAVVDEQALGMAECIASNAMRAVYNPDQIQVNIADAVSTVVLVAHESVGRQAEKKLKMNAKIALKRVVNGKLVVPTRPLPFVNMAKEVIEWLEATKP